MKHNHQPVRLVAEPTHVREVSLLGTADLAFWKSRLARESLVPAESDGRAQILIIAATMKFMGVRFTEVSFAVLVSESLSDQDRGAHRDGAFLIQAFNSCRLFAFCERALFAMPYQQADCRVSVASPVSIQVMKRGAMLFQAEMQAHSPAPPRVPSRTGQDGWEGPVFLPERGGRRGVCFVRIRGQTQAYSFRHAEDAVSIKPSADAGVFQALIESEWTGQEWLVREDAIHGKSKMYEKSER